MKQITLLLLFICLSVAVHGQNRGVDTANKVKLTQLEIWTIHAYTDQIATRIHKLDIPALKRDTLDSMLAFIAQTIEQKYYLRAKQKSDSLASVKKPVKQ